MDKKMLDVIEEMKKKYGVEEDVELGEIPLLSEDMTGEELLMLLRYIRVLIKNKSGNEDTL